MISKLFTRLCVSMLIFCGSLSEAFILYDWNLKHLGRKRFSTEKVASVIADGDLVLIQEVNTTASGKQKLRELQNAILKIPENVNKTICMGISKRPSDGGECYAFLWNQDELMRVDETGKELECDKDAAGNKVKRGNEKIVELELTSEHASEIEREPAYILLKDLKSGRIFLAATVHALPMGNGKTPEHEIPLMFQAVNAETERIRLGSDDSTQKATHTSKQKSNKSREVSLPVNVSILAGDFNLSVRNKPFDFGKSLNYEPVFSSGPLTSLSSTQTKLSKPYDNIFIKYTGGKKPEVKSKKVINLYDRFEGLAISTIYHQISDHCPLRVDIDLNPNPAK